MRLWGLRLSLGATCVWATLGLVLPGCDDDDAGLASESKPLEAPRPLVPATGSLDADALKAPGHSSSLSSGLEGDVRQRSTGGGPAGASQPAVASFQPFLDAEVGEWAEYAALGDRRIRYEVIRADTNTVTSRVETFQGGKPVGQPTERVDSRTTDPRAQQATFLGAEREAGPASTEAAGQQWQAMLYIDRWTDERISYVRRTWVSPEVPVFGTIRMELQGDGVVEAKMELTAFGKKKT